jgi:ribulose-5-phosphate 4-epimerase/fuculose-1-phosphate aldolase
VAHAPHIDDLVVANHILYREKIVDGFGHVSMRHPEDPNRYLISRSLAPALVTADDIVELNLDSTPAMPGTPGSYLERFIHGEIYRARPDVKAVVHSHSAAIIPFGVVPEVTLKAISHMGGFIGAGAAVFEIRNTDPASDMLVRTPELGAALAKSLGKHGMVLMRGHGATMVGFSVRQAVYRAIYAELNARLQSEALRLGKPNYLTDEEAKGAALANDNNMDRAWDLWARAVRGG